MENKKRIYQLDLIRFIAAISVLLYHYTFRGFSAHDMTTIEFEEIGIISRYGYLGVNMFFIISGFVIALSIKKSKISLFIESRLSRLYPTYWLCLILTFLITVTYGAPRYSATFKQFIINLTMFQDHFEIASIDGAYWSLFIEMRFYLFIIIPYLILNT